MEKHKEHLPYFDFLRGVAIMMVVGIHTFPNNTNAYSLMVLRQLLNCAVPLFLALSAFFMAKKSFRNSEDIHSFWKKQIPKVYLPCLVWSVPYFIFSIIQKETTLIVDVIRLFICGYSIYYFIALILQYYLLLPIVINVNKMGGVISCFISMLSISLYVYSNCYLPLILSLGPFWVWIMFFIQGIIMRKHGRNYPINVLIILLLLSIILQFVEFYYCGAGLGINATSFFYSAVILLLLFSSQMQNLYLRCKNNSFCYIEYLGKISFGIYLIHCYIISIINKFVKIEIWGFNFLLTIILTIVAISLIKLIIPYKYHRIVGLF